MAFPAKTDRESILRAATTIVETEGADRLAIRSVAAALGIAPTAIYNYFDGLAELEAALARAVRLEVLVAMREASKRRRPGPAIRAISKTYLHFAAERPRLFALYLKTSGDPERRRSDCSPNSEFFLANVARVYGPERSWNAAHVLWSLLHGLALLHEAGVLDDEQTSACFDLGLRTWIDGANRP